MPILWRVRATWASKGREGETDNVVEAPDAITALKRFWVTEDAEQLRDVTIEWLTPSDCILKEGDHDDDD